MKVSVIIPVYNGEKTIERCIKSILSQTLSDIEIIAVNDGSTDGTLDIIKGFNDSRLSIITQENAGQGYARNTGMNAASGEYIGFVDADDTIETRMYEEMYNLAVKHRAEIVQCNLTDIYPDGRAVTQLGKTEGMVEISDNAAYTAKYLAGYIHSYEVCNKLFSREFLTENSLKFSDTKKYFSEDILFNMDAVKYLKRIYFIKEPYYNYYQNSESHMHAGAQERLRKMVCLFDDYLKNVNGAMKNSASYLAIMTMLYNIGACEAKEPSGLRSAVSLIKPALKSEMSLKRRLYLTAVRFAPTALKYRLARMLVKD